MIEHPIPIAVLDQLARQQEEIAKLREAIRGHEEQFLYLTKEELPKLREQRDRLAYALKAFSSCAIPVSKDIDLRGHTFVGAYLEEALPIARAILAEIEGEKNAKD